jgi:hypothetical protein
MSLLKLKWGIAALLVMVFPGLGWAGQAQPSASPFKGEYFCTRNADPICVPFTKNLNQFRRIDFDVCHPRLSEKYPQFTRPEWEEIPLDLALVELIIKNVYSRPENSEIYWQEWLKVSEPIRQEGKIRLEQARIDLDADGTIERIIRLVHPLAIKEEREGKGWRVNPDRCPYQNNLHYVLDTPNDLMRREFNRAARRIYDIFHFTEGTVSPGQSNGFYTVERSRLLADIVGERIGATRGVTVSLLNRWGAGKVCGINWVPTGAYRPLRRTQPLWREGQ